MTSIGDVLAFLPRLGEAPHKVTSQPADYNCVGWVNRDFKHWWEPEIHWPAATIPVPPLDEPDLDSYVALFESWGFVLCDDGSFEEGLLKIAIYSRDGFFHHVAKQVPPIRWWSSKIGRAHDLRHETLDALYDAPLFEGAVVTNFMQREYEPDDDFALEIDGLIPA